MTVVKCTIACDIFIKFANICNHFYCFHLKSRCVKVIDATEADFSWVCWRISSTHKQAKQAEILLAKCSSVESLAVSTTTSTQKNRICAFFCIHTTSRNSETCENTPSRSSVRSSLWSALRRQNTALKYGAAVAVSACGIHRGEKTHSQPWADRSTAIITHILREDHDVANPSLMFL